MSSNWNSEFPNCRYKLFTSTKSVSNIRLYERLGHDIRIHQSGEYAWISGEELTNIIKRDDFQWIWAVLFGFEKHITLEEVKKYDLPYADGYRGFGEENISIQHPLATIELVAWDSGCTLFISKDDELVNKFRSAFPLSVDLEMYNKGVLDDSEAYEKWLANKGT